MKKMKKMKRSSLKGMTLMEVIVAMAVLIVMTLLVAEAGTAILTNMRASKSVVEKVNYQTKFVAAKSKDMGAGRPINDTTATESYGLTGDDGTVGTLNVTIYEANPDANATYANFDRAGNLKYFEYIPAP